MDNNTAPQDDFMLTLISNVVAINMFLGLKFGEEGAASLAQLEEQARHMLTSSNGDQVEQETN